MDEQSIEGQTTCHRCMLVRDAIVKGQNTSRRFMSVCKTLSWVHKQVNTNFSPHIP